MKKVVYVSAEAVEKLMKGYFSSLDGNKPHPCFGGLVAAGYYSTSRDVVTAVLLGGAVHVGSSLYQSKSMKGKKRYSCSA